MASDSLRQNLIQVSRFSAVGVVNTLVGLAIIWGSMYLGLGYVKANILGYAVGLIVSFTLNSRWTFSQRAKKGGSTSATYALRFLIAFLIAWGANYLVLIFGVRSFNLSQYIAQLGAMTTYTVVFFLLCRAFVFSAKSEGNLMATKPNSSSLGQKHWVPILALSLIYAVIYGPSVFARIVDSEFMEIDPRSIMTSLDGLTTGPTYYNMNKQYHSQFYGWTYFSLNFFLIMIAKLFAVTSEMSINLIVRGSLFIIGLGLVAQTYYLVQKFFARIWAFALTIVVIVNPVSAHYFITIHPESLGVLLQLIAVGILISLYQNLPKFSKKKFFLAVLFLSLSSLSKQPFFITGTFVYIGFLIIALTTAEKPVALAGWWPICKVTLQSIGVFLLVLLFIHPYALVQMDEFLAAQSSLSGEHAGKSFPEVWPRWRAQLLANFLPLINIALLPFILLLRQVPLALKVSAVFTMLAVVIFILNARLFVNINYLYPVYFFLSFNAFYFVFKVVVPRVRHTAGHAVGAGLQGVCVALIAVVSLSNFAHAVTKTHQRFLLDGLTTQHVTWSYLEQFETGTRVVFSPNVAVLAPLIATSCNAWSGCGDQVGIADYDPDIVVFSPEYPHFEAAEFETFVSQGTYELRKTVEAQDWPELSACTATPAGIQAGETIGIGLVVAHYLSNPLRCKTAYVASLQAYADQAIVLGYDTRIYVKGQ